MESAFSFALLRVLSISRGGAGQDLLFAGRGSLFFRGAGRASLMVTHHMMEIKKFSIQPKSICFLSLCQQTLMSQT